MFIVLINFQELKLKKKKKNQKKKNHFAVNASWLW